MGETGGTVEFSIIGSMERLVVHYSTIGSVLRLVIQHSIVLQGQWAVWCYHIVQNYSVNGETTKVLNYHRLHINQVVHYSTIGSVLRLVVQHSIVLQGQWGVWCYHIVQNYSVIGETTKVLNYHRLHINHIVLYCTITVYSLTLLYYTELPQSPH